MNFTPAFHLKLKQVAELERKPMSQWVEEQLAPILNEQDKQRIHDVYQGLRELEGMVKNGAPDASTTIDDFLYGESGEMEAREQDA